MIMPCLVQPDSLQRLVHPDTEPVHRDLLALLAQHDSLSVLKRPTAHTDLGHRCLICAQHHESEDILQHFVHSHGFLDTYGPLFAGLWIKLHLAHTAFVTTLHIV